ncbi:MAG: glycine--tRNA ligase [Candidatus Babeliales bacterium]
MSSITSTVTLEKLISFCKRRGFVYQSAEIYGGLNGLYDFGHLGTLLKKNIRTAWLQSIYAAQDNIFLFEGSLLSPEAVWQASGHLEHFHDPMVDCLSCKRRYRADDIDLSKACPHCGKKEWTDIRSFNMMFKTQVGASIEHATTAYLRPETAQSIFINFKNIISTNRTKLPFGAAQIGKAFRNEINPKHFLFRMREFEQMELEWFCKEENAQYYFDFWCKHRLQFHYTIGLSKDKLRLRSYEKDELSHYSMATSDIEYEFPFGWKELEGIAHRGSFDLTQHSNLSGKELSIYDEETKESYIPHVIESSVGVDRLFLTLLFDAYHEEKIENEIRIVLKLTPQMAPIKAAFLPLTKKQTEPMHAIYKEIKKEYPHITFDETGSIGKRYRRQDEIGTPVCFTYDFESEADNTVTMRDRDSMKQERMSIDQIKNYIKTMLQKKENG